MPIITPVPPGGVGIPGGGGITPGGPQFPIQTTINVIGIDSAEFVQSPVVVPPTITVVPVGGIISEEVFGIPTIQISQLIISPTSIASLEAFGPVVLLPIPLDSSTGAVVLLSLEDEGEDTMGLPVYYEFYESVAPSDTVNFAYPCRAIYVGTGGDVQAVRGDGTIVPFKAVPTGSLLRIEALRVNLSNTTASFMVQMR